MSYIIINIQRYVHRAQLGFNFHNSLTSDKCSTSAIFIPRQDTSTKSGHVQVPYVLRFDGSCIHLLIGSHEAQDAGVIWLSDSLLPTVARWCSNCSVQRPLTGSLRLVNLEEYNDCYCRLKAQYGKQLVKAWTERTDPKKFVYEDIAIAAYLLTLWKQEREISGCDRMQTFVDLGCGNGLLVYLLASENHRGYGIDIRKRAIWDSFGSKTVLFERTFEPSDSNLFPDADWLIGNHSDELTPWIPVIAAKSSPTCNFFVIPCCAFDFHGKFQRKDGDLSKYQSYLRYVRQVGELCGFESHDDILKIPSTKRACIVGKRRETVPPDILHDRLKLNRKEESSSAKWTDEFVPRPTKEPIRNCTTLPKDGINHIIKKIVESLLKVDNYQLNVENEHGKWNCGGTLTIGDCSKLLDVDDLKLMKNQCGGLQTLLKNHLDGGKISLRNWVTDALPCQKKDSKSCWFAMNHPDGCPLSAATCPYSHMRTTS